MPHRWRSLALATFACAAMAESAVRASEEKMTMIRSDGAELAVETFERDGDPAIVLAMGATASMLGWPEAFCEALAEHGFRVVRFDHRDTGRSTSVPPGEARYAVEDMADDVTAVMDGLGIGRAHLVGMSLGGYISQIAALAHPDRVATLTLIASEPLGWDGEPLPHIEPAFLAHFSALATLDWSDRDAVETFLVEIERLSSGGSDHFDAHLTTARVRRVLDRSATPASMFNHAMLEMREDWNGRFRDIGQPVLVIHGALDPVLPLANGEAIAQGVHGSTMLALAGVGHELPPAEFDRIAGRIADHAAAARTFGAP